jgi:hypothetical protein
VQELPNLDNDFKELSRKNMRTVSALEEEQPLQACCWLAPALQRTLGVAHLAALLAGL